MFQDSPVSPVHLLAGVVDLVNAKMSYFSSALKNPDVTINHHVLQKKTKTLLLLSCCYLSSYTLFNLFLPPYFWLDNAERIKKKKMWDFNKVTYFKKPSLLALKLKI